MLGLDELVDGVFGGSPLGIGLLAVGAVVAVAGPKAKPLAKGAIKGYLATTERAREWGRYLAARGVPKPGTRSAARHNLAVLQEAMASAGFDPRFRRASDGTVEVTLRDCPFRELLDDHRDLVCSIHQGLVEGMLGALEPPLSLEAFTPLTERAICRVEVREPRP